MTLRALATPFLLALLVPCLESGGALLGAEELAPVALARGSLAALALLPWLALSAWPRPAREDLAGSSRASSWRAPFLVGCLALPPLGLGVGLDLARGADPRALAAAALGAWTVLLLWVGAAERAAAAPRAARVFAVLWLALLPGAAALRLALAWVPARASSGPSGPGALFALDPLVWCQRWGREGGLASFAPRELGLALGAALSVFLVVLALAREAEASA